MAQATTHGRIVGSGLALEHGRLESWVIGFLGFANVFDMGGEFGLKYGSYLLVAGLLVLRRDHVRVSRAVFFLIVFLFLVWPLIAAIQGTVRGGDLSRAVQRVTSFGPALLVLPLVATSDSPRRLLDAIMDSLLALAVVIICFFGLLALFPTSRLSVFVLDHFHDSGHGYFGSRQLGSIAIPTVYFKATLFLVPACIWFLYRRLYLASALCFTGLVLAFSRSGALIASAFVVFHVITQAPIKVRIGMICLLCTVGYVLWSNAELLQIGAILDLYLEVLTGQGQSASERAGHFKSIMEILSFDPTTLWLGQGAGVFFYSSGVNHMVSAVELDHLDAIRSFGLIWFMGFCTWVFRAAGIGMHVESAEQKGLRVALLASFLASGTNPVLISPVFCMLTVVSYYFMRSDLSTCKTDP